MVPLSKRTQPEDRRRVTALTKGSQSLSGEGRQEIRCAIYTRQSVDIGRSDDFSSCQAQWEACESFVLSMKYERWRLIPERFDDVGYSGKDFNRPAFQRLLVWIAKAKVDQLVVHRFDRLSRNLRDWVKLSDFLKEYSVDLSIVDGGIEATGGAFMEFITNILATFGQFEREIIQDRMQEARRYRASKGMRFAGKPPLGYRSDPASRQLIVEEAEAKLVRRIFETAAAGKSGAEIARILNEDGVRTKTHGKTGGKQWTGRTVLQMIRNPVYLGKRLFKGEWILGVHEPIIDTQLAEKAFAQLGARRFRKPGRLQKAVKDSFMLRGILRCGNCDRVMTTSTSRKKVTVGQPEVYRYYRCRGNADSLPCRPTVQVAAHIVERQVERLLADPWKIIPASQKVKRMLTLFSNKWETLSEQEKAALIRELIWSATWNPQQQKTQIYIDEINLERIAKDVTGG
jgi:site-specific DNA recombinase